MDTFLDINNKVLKLAGMWVPNSHASRSEKLFYYAYDIAILSYSCVLYPICEWIKFNETFSDLAIFMIYLRMNITHIWGFVKVTIWHTKRVKLYQILDTLKKSSDDKEFLATDHMKAYWKENELVNRVRTVILMCLAGGMSVAGCVGAFSTVIFNPDSLYGDTGTVLGNSSEVVITKKLPYLMWVPFEYNHSRFVYALAIAFQWYGTFQQAVVITAFDCYYISVLSYIAIQFRILQKLFRTIRERSLKKLGIKPSLENKDCVLLRQEMHREMKRLTIQVQVLIKTCEDLEDLFTYPLHLGQTIYTSGTLCPCLYMVTTLPMMSMKFLTELVFLTANSLELFMFSLFATKVTDDALNIPNALFYSDWYTSDVAYKRNIIINMVRMQKPIYLTIAKMQTISLSTFVMISKAAYSFCAVVKSVRSK